MKPSKRLQTLISIMVVVLWVCYLYSHRQDFHFLGTLSLSAVAALCVIMFVACLFDAFQLRILTSFYGIELKFSQWFGLYRASALVNQILPLSSGSVVRALYLKKLHKLKYASYIAFSSMNQFTRLTVNMLGVFFVLLFQADLSKTFILSISAVFGFGGLLFICVFHLVPRSLMLNRWVESLFEEWTEIRRSGHTLAWVVLLQGAIWLLGATRLFVGYQVFDVNASFATCCIISGFLAIPRLFSLVPGNIGVREAFIVGLSGALGATVNAGLHVAALDRLIGLALNLFFASHFAANIFQIPRDELECEAVYENEVEN